MIAQKKIEEKVSQLVGEARSIFVRKDQMFANLERASDETTGGVGWMGPEERAECYRLALEISGDYAAWYPPALYLVGATFPSEKSTLKPFTKPADPIWRIL